MYKISKEEIEEYSAVLCVRRMERKAAFTMVAKIMESVSLGNGKEHLYRDRRSSRKAGCFQETQHYFGKGNLFVPSTVFPFFFIHVKSKNLLHLAGVGLMAYSAIHNRHENPVRSTRLLF